MGYRRTAVGVMIATVLCGCSANHQAPPSPWTESATSGKLFLFTKTLAPGSPAGHCTALTQDPAPKQIDGFGCASTEELSGYGTTLDGKTYVYGPLAASATTLTLTTPTGRQTIEPAHQGYLLEVPASGWTLTANTESGDLTAAKLPPPVPALVNGHLQPSAQPPHTPSVSASP